MSLSLNGACHCGSVRAAFMPSMGADALPLRACQCGFCRRHGAQTTSDPRGSLHLTAAPGGYRRYRFGRRVVDALLCRECGIYIGSFLEIDGVLVGTLNVAGLQLEGFDGREPVIRNYAQESDEERLERRREQWTPTVLVQASPQRMTDILMPALSPTMEEGGLAKWHVKPGDTVASGDIIAEIETDKATMEVEAVDEGVVEALLVEAGAQGVKVGTPIARLKGEGEAAAPKAPPAKPKAKAAEEAPKPRPEPAAAPAEPSAEASAAPPPPAPPKAEQSGPTTKRIFASPLARRLAEQAGVDLAAVKGSGPHGRIIKRDLEGAPRAEAKPQAEAKLAAAASAPAPTAAPAQAQSLEQLGIAPGSYDLLPLDGMKRTIAKRMTEAVQTIPSFPLTVDLEIDALLAARTAINALLEKDGVKVSVNDLVIKAAAMALMRVREANASYTPEGIAMHHHADVAMAVAVEGGLITPIVRSADEKGLAKIAAETKDLAERARTRKLKPEEYMGGTFSVSNLGMMGIREFGSIINAPQGAILSVGAGQRRPVVREGDKLEIATVMTVTMTCDHRVIDGATGARWLAAFKTMIEQPAAMLA